MSDDKRRNLRDMLDELDRYFEEFEKDIQEAVREGISGSKIFSKPFMAGFQMRLGPEGKPSVQFFGDNPQHADGYRVPLTEQALDLKNGVLRLVLDMPGVEKGDIEISATDGNAMLKAERDGRKYRAEIQLKAQVEPESGKAEYRNGVLEISFSLKDKANKGSRRVNVV
ncbi:MAG: Hsp20 family protein [Nitrososphaerales archaeon]|nr:Hsp20 family protein [Nitrososphaerales archaeon]